MALTGADDLWHAWHKRGEANRRKVRVNEVAIYPTDYDCHLIHL